MVRVNLKQLPPARQHDCNRFTLRIQEGCRNGLGLGRCIYNRMGCSCLACRLASKQPGAAVIMCFSSLSRKYLANLQRQLFLPELGLKLCDSSASHMNALPPSLPLVDIKGVEEGETGRGGRGQAHRQFDIHCEGNIALQVLLYKGLGFKWPLGFRLAFESCIVLGAGIDVGNTVSVEN